MVHHKETVGVGGWSIMGSRLLRYHLGDCIFDGFSSSEQGSPFSSTPLRVKHRSGDKVEDENGSAASFSVQLLSFLLLSADLEGLRFNADLTCVCACKQIKRERESFAYLHSHPVPLFSEVIIYCPRHRSSRCSVSNKHSCHATNTLRKGDVFRIQKKNVIDSHTFPFDFIFSKILSSSLSLHTHTLTRVTQKHTHMQITQAWCNYCSLGNFYPLPAEKWPANEIRRCNIIKNNH